jgi:hypothetical protein
MGEHWKEVIGFEARVQNRRIAVLGAILRWDNS